MSNASLAGPPAGPATASAVTPPSGAPTPPRGSHGPAVAALIDRALRPADGDRLVVVFTPTFKQAAVHVTAAARRSGAGVKLAAPPGGDFVASAGRIRAALRELEPSGGAAADQAADGGRRIVLFLGGPPVDLPGLGLAPQLIAVQLGASADESGTAPQAWEDPDAHAGRSAALHAGLLRRTTLPLVSGTGCELVIGWEPDRPPALDDGAPTPGELIQLPSDQVAIEVADADGVFLADRALHVNRPVRLGGPLRDRPVRLELTAGRVTGLSCPDPHTEAFLRRAVTVHRVARLRQAWCRPSADGRTEVRLCLGADDDVPRSDPAADLRIVLGARVGPLPPVASPSEPERI